jgi:hypothetical protein
VGIPCDRLRSGQNERLLALEGQIASHQQGTRLEGAPSPGRVAADWFTPGRVPDDVKRRLIEAFLEVQLLRRPKGERIYDPSRSVRLRWARRLASEREWCYAA